MVTSSIYKAHVHKQAKCAVATALSVQALVLITTNIQLNVKMYTAIAVQHGTQQLLHALDTANNDPYTV
jgi:hypothetical protein